VNDDYDDRPDESAARIFLRESCFLVVVVGLTLYLSVASVCDRVASVVRR
jgi:hypothetical protein